jgi:predicted nuclease of predicted toxin-antitoxin system
VRFLVDHQLPPALVVFIRERGHESQHLLDVGMASSSDAEIYAYADAQRYIIVTKDEDFFYLARRIDSDVSLLWIRLGNCRTAALLWALDRKWTEIVRCFEAGDRVVEIR